MQVLNRVSGYYFGFVTLQNSLIKDFVGNVGVQGAERIVVQFDVLVAVEQSGQVCS